MVTVCEICLHNPCLKGCPNETFETIGTCAKCKNPIEVGMQYIDTGDGMVCEDCVDDMPVKQLIEMLGYRLETATKEDY